MHQNPLTKLFQKGFTCLHANTFLFTIAHCFKSKNYVNLMVGSKQPSAVFLTADEAENHCYAGCSIWKLTSADNGLNPDAVIVGIGSELTFEIIAAAYLLKKRVPELRVRIVSVTDLMILAAESVHPHALKDDSFNSLFGEDIPCTSTIMATRLS